MGRITDFDHYKLVGDLDIASWASYPLSFLEDRVGAEAAHKKQFARQGDPDFQAFHHDLYRGVGKGRWWVMEQQPGPVNWAPFNPDPLPGMLRLRTWEAFAHGAEVVCYLRWRQSPMAQEQMHSGLLRPDSGEAPALEEVREMARDIALASDVPLGQSDVGLMFDYDADAMWHIQPHGAGISYFDLVFEVFKALRTLGLSIDFLPPTIRNFDGYKVVLELGIMYLSTDLQDALSKAEAQVVIGLRAAARDVDMINPLPLPPDLKGFDVSVVRVESLRPDMPLPLDQGGVACKYREILEGSALVVLHAEDQSPVAMRHENMTYLGAWLDQVGLRRLFKNVCQLAHCEIIVLPQGVRARKFEREKFWFNYGTLSNKIEGQDFPPISVKREVLKG